MRSRMIRVVLVVGLASSVAACQWSAPRFGNDGSGHNTFESRISIENVATVEVEQTLPVPGGSRSRSGEPLVPVVADRTIVVTSPSVEGAVRAYEVGDPACAGEAPVACAPLWSSVAVDGAGQAVLALGRVFVPVGPDLHVYDAAGVEGCSGTPVRCEPIWAAPGWGELADVLKARTYDASVVVDGNRAFVTRGTHLGAFDAWGDTGCSGVPRTCSPLWSAVDPTTSAGEVWLSPPSVVDGVVYVGLAIDERLAVNGGYSGGLRAFDAEGVEGCAGAPVVCTPTWSAAAPGAVGRAPAVVDGTLFAGYTWGVESFDEDGEPYYPTESGVAAYDVAACAAAGSCARTWYSSAWSGGAPGRTGVTVAGGVVHVVNGARHDRGDVATFPVDGGPSCGGAVACTPLRRAVAPGRVGADAAVANGVLYVGASAFAADGSSGCAGTPTVCQPLWGAGVTDTKRATVVSNGRVITVLDASSGARVVLHRLP